MSIDIRESTEVVLPQVSVRRPETGGDGFCAGEERLAKPTTFSVIIPVPPGSKPPRALEGLSSSCGWMQNVEVLIVEGTSPAAQRNLGARSASGEVLVFLDDDSLVGEGFFDILERRYRDPRTVGVGGPNLALAIEGKVQFWVERVLCARTGTSGIRAKFSAAGRARPMTEDEIILCNFTARRDFFFEAGGFDGRLYPNEETEFIKRIRRDLDGKQVLYEPELVVHRPRPTNLRDHVLKVIGYGRGRARQTLVSPARMSFLRLTPAAFLLHLCALPLLAHVNLAFLAPIGLYLAAACGWALCNAYAARRIRELPLALRTLVATHVAYGWGTLKGFTFEYFRRGNACSEHPLTLSHVKRFGGGL